MRRIFHTRATGIVAAVAIAIGAGGLTWMPADASINQPSLVSTNPENFTPNIMDGKVLAVAQVGDTIILGGKFTSVTSANGATSYNRASARPESLDQVVRG